MLTVLAPAKINLTLEVLKKRADGYHEIASVIQAIDLCDILTFDAGDGTEIVCDDPAWQAKESLIPLAASLLREYSNTSRGVRIVLSKMIPLLSGLAGDSSCAAATLKGLNSFWELGYTAGYLAEFAAKLGSDITFFFSGGTALVQGRGEIVSPLPPLPQTWLVLLIPEVARTIGKTGKLYSSLRPQYFTTGKKTDNLVNKLAGYEKIDDSVLFNVFEKVAYHIYDGLDKCRDDFSAAGAASVHLAGSGPTLYAMTGDKSEAIQICERLTQKGYRSHAVKTLGNDYMIKADAAV